MTTPTSPAPSRLPPVARHAAVSAGRSATIVGAAFVLSRALGLLREIILGYRFGTSSEYDAYVSAFRVPDLLFLVVMSGAFGAAFIPVFGGMLQRKRTRDAWRLASAVASYAALLTVLLALIVFVIAGPLMRHVVAPELPADVQPLAVRTMRILLLSPIFLGLGIAAKGMLEAQELFTLPALAPVLYNAAVILAALILAPRYGIEGVAWGVVAGAALHFAIQVPGLVASGARFTPTLNRHVRGLGEVAQLLGPRVIGLAAFQLNFIAVTHLATGAGEGRVSALNYAWQMMMLPHGVVALSISTVIFPAMARQFESRQLAELRATFTKALMPLLFLTVPASIGLFELRTALPQAVFQFGAFDERSTALVSPALALLSAGLIWYAAVEVLTRVFYAMRDTRTPVIAGMVIVIVNIALGAVLVQRIDHRGLAIALSASTGIEALILFAVLRRRTGTIGEELGSWLGRVALAAAAMACMAELIRPKLEAATEIGGASRAVAVLLLGFAISLLAATYLAAAWYLRVPEAVRVVRVMSARLPEPALRLWRFR